MYGRPVEEPENRLTLSDKSLLNTYEILTELGAGGGGTVYKAWHKRLRKDMVLKELKDSACKTNEARRNEIEALKNIKNMHIPIVFDFFTTPGDSCFTVMEYVEGDNLEKLLMQGKMFSPERVTKWYYQLATALEALHKNGVCHRDIKPGNIILTQSGDVCLIDYGSAWVSGNNTKTINHSFGYASPEQALFFRMCKNTNESLQRGQSAVSKYQRIGWVDNIDWKLSDIYSLGATMYHLLTGKRPPPQVDAMTHISVIGEHTSDVAAVIERSMRYNPLERYTSAPALRTALQNLIKLPM